MVRIVFSTLTALVFLLYCAPFAQAGIDEENAAFNKPFDDMRASARQSQDRVLFSDDKMDDKVTFEKPQKPHEIENSFGKSNGSKKSLGSIINDQLSPSGGQ